MCPAAKARTFVSPALACLLGTSLELRPPLVPWASPPKPEVPRAAGVLISDRRKLYSRETLVHEYRGPETNLYHIDLYRIDTLRELETLGLDDLRSDNSILLIEWGEKFRALVAERDVEILLEREGENRRRIRISG